MIQPSVPSERPLIGLAPGQGGDVVFAYRKVDVGLAQAFVDAATALLAANPMAVGEATEFSQRCRLAIATMLGRGDARAAWLALDLVRRGQLLFAVASLMAMGVTELSPVRPVGLQGSKGSSG